MVSSQAVGPCKRDSEEETVGLHEGIPSVPKITVPPTQTSCIFLPAAGNRNDSSLNNVGSNGNYWSSSLNTDGPGDAWYLGFYSDDYDMGSSYRCCGRSVRPVCASQN